MFLVVRHAAQAGIDRGFLRLAAHDIEEGRQRLAARLAALPADIAVDITDLPLQPAFGVVPAQQAVGRVAQHIGVGHAAAGLSHRILDIGHLITKKCRRHAHHIALAMTDNGNRYVGLFLADRLHQMRQAQRGQHEVGTRRTGIHDAVVDGVQVLDMDPQEQGVRQPLAPQIRQGRAAIGERAAAPVIVFVQVDRIAIVLQFSGAGLVAPAEVDHRREMRLRRDEGAGRVIGIDVTVICQLAFVAHRRQLPGLRRGMAQVLVATLHACIQALAQAFLRRAVPLAVGIDAVHEDDDAGGRHLLHAREQAVAVQASATEAPYDIIGGIITRVAGIGHGKPLK